MQIPEGSEDLDNYSFNNDDFNYVNDDLDSDFSYVDSDVSNDGLEHFDLCNDNVEPDFRIDNADKESDLRGFLYHWAITYQLRQNALTSLLHGLKKYGHDDLPSDARTLLHTQKKTTVSSVGSGLYSHYGLKKGLLDQLKCFDPNKIPKDIALHLNIDGLPLSKSSPSQVWPILVKIVNYPYATCDPFAVGIFHGNRKPEDVNLFLEPTIMEYLELSNTGFIFNNQRYRIFIKLFAADTVARNQILCFPPHNSRCGKCIQVGKTVQHRRVFLENDSPLRTDNNFRIDVPNQYKNLLSPLEGIGMSLTNQVPLDPMYLLDEGVGKKHLKLLLNLYGNSNVDALKRIKNINDQYVSFKEWVPCEFVRKTRTLNEIDRFKATELRMAILYIAPVVFQSTISNELMLHFNVLNCALRILYDANECIKNNQYAKDLLIYYVDCMKNFYGEQHIVYNVHNLIHLPDDVLRFGSLDGFSVIDFENHLQVIKKLVRKGSYVLTQIMNRINEKSQLKTNVKLIIFLKVVQF